MRVLYDPEAAAGRDDLYATYRTLRDEHPVYLDPDSRFAALTRFADVADAATDAATYSSEITANTTLVHPILAQIDPPRHTAMRRLILRAFTPSRVAEREAEVRAIAVDLLDTARDCAVDADGFDLVGDFAALLPSIVMGRLIGIPDDLVPTCREISDLHMRRISQRDALVPMRMSDDLFRPLLAARRAAPVDDLLSGLVTAEVDGRRLTDEELLGFCYLLLIGGNDTTTNWIGNTAVLFAEHPDVRARVVDEPSLLPAALEESLRLESPTQLLPRRTSHDVTLHDTLIAAGTRVLLVWGAANRDEREFPSAERYIVPRAESRHLAFGQGIHFCLGAALARLEARVAFEELLRRLPAYELAHAPEPLRSSWALGHARPRTRMNAPADELALTPLDASFGACVEGLDLTAPITPDIEAALQTALDEYHLLVVHVPHLAPVGQQRLAAVFGPLLDESRDGSGYTLVSDRPGGSIREGPLLFHSDLAFTSTPLVAISLYALEVPVEGTSTHFADAVRAAGALRSSTVDSVRGRHALHVYPLTDARGDRRFRVATVDADAPRATHPVLMPHPRTGNPVLFVSQMQTDAIVELDEPTSEAVLAELWSELYAPTNVYTHHWHVGDLVVWDNLAVQHARDDVVPGSGRTLRRVPVGTYAVQLRGA